MELLNTLRPIYSLSLGYLEHTYSAKVLPTNPHVGFAIPTWLRGLWLRRGRCWAGSVLCGALREETPPRRELHAQLLCHLHVVPGVDIVKDAAACQLHLGRKDKGWERQVSQAFLCSNSIAQWFRFWAAKKTHSAPRSNPGSKSSSSNTSRFLKFKEKDCFFFFSNVFI